MPLPNPDIDISSLDQLYTPNPVVRTTEEMGLPIQNPINEYFIFSAQLNGGGGSSYSNNGNNSLDSTNVSFDFGLVDTKSIFGSAFEYAIGVGHDNLRVRLFYSQKEIEHNTAYVLQEGGSGDSSFSTEIVRTTQQHKDFKHIGMDVAIDITDSILSVLGVGFRTIKGDEGTSTEKITHYRNGEEVNSAKEEESIYPFNLTDPFLRFGAGLNKDLGDIVEVEVLGLVHVGPNMDTYYVLQMGVGANF